jgi:pantetheine-phosphate adenylyltransferase
MTPDNRIAVCAGSYDPITNGHLDIIARASAMFDQVVVGVANSPFRKSKPLFTAEERVHFILNATGYLGNVEAEPFANLLVEFAADRGAKSVVKGLRAISDVEYELEMNQLNHLQAPEIESVYLMASAKYSFIRSSGVKELATYGGNIDDLVPAEVAAALKERLGR